MEAKKNKFNRKPYIGMKFTGGRNNFSHINKITRIFDDRVEFNHGTGYHIVKWKTIKTSVDEGWWKQVLIFNDYYEQIR